MPEIPVNESTHAGVTPVKSDVCAVLLQQVGWEIYRGNPFRLLGLPVQGGARELNKRVDELKMAAEFGIAQADWSFGPEQALTLEQIRSAAQELKDPAERLVWEFFWFWPENFPEDAVDPALEHLSRGETAEAVEIWQGSAMQGKGTAYHNLAVYYHMQALEREREETPADDELVQLWFKALRFWEKVGGDDGLWTRLIARVVHLADARVTAEFVQDMRRTLPQALAKICASLALHHGKRGLTNRAALHAALVTHIHGDAAGARRALEEYVAPLAARIEARTIEATNRLAVSSGSGVEEGRALLRHCAEDLRLVELLCGRTSDYFVEVSDGLVEAILDCVVAYQRETQDNFGCLPLLCFLQDMEMQPELRGRVKETFDAVYGNALVRATRPPMEAGGNVESLVSSDDARACRLIEEHIIPGLEALGLTDAARQSYVSRAAGMLKNLAIGAGMERDDINLALRAFDIALQLPLTEALRDSLESDRAQLHRDFETRKEKELQVESDGSKLIVNRHGICLNDQWLTLAEIAGVRHGIVRISEGENVTTSHVIAWRSYSGLEFELNASNLLPASSYVEEHYMRILNSIYHFVVPGLVERLAADIRQGREVFLGTRELRSEGIVWPESSMLFWKKDEPISYTKLQTSIEGGLLIVSSKENPRQSETFDVAIVWNAAVFGYVLEALTRD
ncbi:MAG: hypothetical protein QM790_20395 [Nibricoccus sp.]